MKTCQCCGLRRALHPSPLCTPCGALQTMDCTGCGVTRHLAEDTAAEAQRLASVATHQWSNPHAARPAAPAPVPTGDPARVRHPRPAAPPRRKAPTVLTGTQPDYRDPESRFGWLVVGLAVGVPLVFVAACALAGWLARF